jgi:hypothetical protein
MIHNYRNVNSFINMLPPTINRAGLVVKTGCRTLLTHVWDGDSVWVILLTAMPGKRCQAWQMTRSAYLNIVPKYGSRDRWVRENMQPTIVGDVNPSKPCQLLLF